MQRHVAAVLAFILTIACAGGAFAQGTSGRFPDPIDYDGLLALLEPLGLSESQRAALEGPHASYLAQFDQLRTQRIERYLDASGALFGPNALTPEQLATRLEERGAIMRAIATLENTLMATVRPLVSEDQATLLPRLTERRERNRLSIDPTQMGWQMPPLGGIDLVRALSRAKLTPEDWAAIDAPLAAYEASITPAYRRIFKDRLEALVERQKWQRDMEERLRNGNGPGPDGFTPFAAPIDDRVRDEVVRVSRQSRRALEQVVPLLDPDTGSRVTNEFYRLAYSTLGAPRDVLTGRVKKAVLDEQYSADIHAALEALLVDYTTSRLDGLRRLVDAAEDAGFRMHDGTEGESLRAPRKALIELNERSLERYAALTGTEVPKQRRITFDGGGTEIVLDSPLAISNADVAGGGEFMISVTLEAAEGPAEAGATEVIAGPPIVLVGRTGTGDEGVAEIVMWDASPGGRWLPKVMPVEALDRIAARLNLDEMDRVVLDELYAPYAEAFAALRDGAIAEAERATHKARSSDATQASIAAAFSSVRDAMESVRGADDAFFADVRVLMNADDEATARNFARLRSMRERRAHTQETNGFMFGPTGQEHAVDAVRVVDETDLSEADDDAAWTALAEYERALGALEIQYWERRLAAAEESAQKTREQREATPDRSFFFGSPPDAMAPEHARSRAERNRAALTALERALSPEGFDAVRRAYLRSAFPSVYPNRDNTDAALTKAGGLALDPARKDTLLALASAYRAEFDACSERMVTVMREAAAAPTQDGEAHWEKFQETEQAVERIRFERDNLGQVTMTRLIALLDPAERAEIGLASDDD